MAVPIFPKTFYSRAFVFVLLTMRKPASQNRIVHERIDELLRQADAAFAEHPSLSRRYVALARRMAMKYKARLSVEQKRLFCKRCNAYLKQGHNCTVRLVHGKLVTTCKECGDVKRMVYRK